VAIAFFPLVVLVVRLANDERQATTLRERDASLRLLDVALAEHRELTRTGLELLRHLPGMVDIASGDPATCSHALRSLLGTYANFNNAARITRDLRVDCSASAPAEFTNASAVPAVLKASTTARLLIWIQFGPLGQPVATIIEPVRDPNGGLLYYLSLDADLSWFSHVTRAIPQDPGAMAAIVDSTGFILARQPDEERFAGSQQAPSGPLLQMIGNDSGFVEGIGLAAPAAACFRALPRRE
jgi:hypothetical protein